MKNYLQESRNLYLYGINPYGMSDSMPYRPPPEILPTEFDLVVGPEQVTTLTVLNGQVDFGTVFNTWAVPASTMSSASRGGPCSKPKEVEVHSVLAWAEEIRSLVEQSERKMGELGQAPAQDQKINPKSIGPQLV